ncbi:MAG TPA: hypothetical protein PKC13_06345 [Blastocatellia bacterium]|nr:hypothetical protein [Blastocatellia bacterium]HMY70387.1 hypothetical protein [Blastocatellia bacterium]
MNNKKLFLGFVLLLGLLGAAFAFQKPNFSGKWELDKIKSFSNPAGLEQSATITQNGDQITFDTRVKTKAGGEQKLTESYTLDGKEVDFKPAAPPNATGKRTASWLPNGRGVLVKDETSVDGTVVSTVTRKWMLAADGKSLTVDYYIDRPNGTFESKRVFNKIE